MVELEALLSPVPKFPDQIPALTLKNWIVAFVKWFIGCSGG
jgi:hypothetical protein